MGIKATFILDEDSIKRLDRAASLMSKSKSEIVREAIRAYQPRPDRLSESERRRMLRAIKKMMATPSTKTQADVDRELRELRRSRRGGWSRPSDLR